MIEYVHVPGEHLVKDPCRLQTDFCLEIAMLHSLGQSGVGLLGV